MRESFALNPALDAAALAEEYRHAGRVSIANILEPASAEALHQHLRARTDWLQVVNSGDAFYELTRAARADMAEAQRGALEQAVYAGARYGFQYRYETVRVPDDDAARAASDDALCAFARWWSDGPPRALLAAITGCETITFADAQATAYGPGDFLTSHDDLVEGKHRVAAYVLSLTPKWRMEWGGLLLFHDAGDPTAQAVAPVFNQLNLFAVGQMHSVSEVTRAAAYRRYSITGWLRTAR